MRQITLIVTVLGPWMLNIAWAAEVNHTLALSVVQVQAYPRDGRAFVGSGVVVDYDRVATNCHVTRHADSIVVGKGALRYRAASQRADLKHDLCILEAPGMSLPVASLGTTSVLSVGETIYMYGYPRAIGIAFAEGRVERLHPYDGSLVIETTAGFVQGASGSGIFDQDGRLVGLATFFSGRQDRTLCHSRGLDSGSHGLRPPADQTLVRFAVLGRHLRAPGFSEKKRRPVRCAELASAIPLKANQARPWFAALTVDLFLRR
jgi:hypothetical protein